MPLEFENENKEAPASRVQSQFFLIALGTVPVLGSALLVARLTLEETVWTWQRGPQAVGFSLAHGSGVMLFIFPVLLMVWTAVAAVVVLVIRIGRRRILPATWMILGVAVVIFGVMSLPEGFWERVFIRQMARSYYAGDLTVDAAYRGDFAVVRAMLSHGIPVGTVDHSQWRTPLHAAAWTGNVRLVRFLLSRGADINALDRSGDSPFELSASNNHPVCTELLEKYGGKRIKGDKAQHDKGSEDQVREEIDRMDRARAHNY